MATVEVLENGGVGYGITSCRDNAYVNGGKRMEKLRDDILEDLDLYWVTVSRMVSDSLIKGMVSAVEQEAAETIMAKEIEFTKLKEYLQFHNVGLSKTESLGSPVLQDVLESLKHSDVFWEHEKTREILGGLRNSATDELKKLKKAIHGVRGSSSISRICSGSELVGLGGILRDQESESWVHVDRTVKHLKMIMDTIFTHMDGMVQSSKASIERWQEEHLIEVEVEAMVMRNLIQSIQENFEYKLWDQYSQSCDTRVEKLNDISSLRNDLEVILKSLSSVETQSLTSHGSQDVDQFHRMMSSEHVTSSKLIWEGNGKWEDSKSDIPEKFEAATLKHMSREEMVDYFNNMMTKMKREHKSILEKITDDYFSLRAEYLTLIGRGSVVQHKKDQGEFDFLRKKIPEVIMKLEDISVETEMCFEFTRRPTNWDSLKDRIDTILSENRQLKDLLRDKKNEVRFLLSEVSTAAEKSLQHTHSLAEENMQKQIGDINLLVEDSQIAASISEEVYTCFLRDLIGKKGSKADESNMEFLIMNDIYDVILTEAYITAESTYNSELEDSELERLIMQDLYGVIFTEGIKDAEDKLQQLYPDYLNEKENRIFLEMKAIQKEYELTLEVEEKEKLKQKIYLLERSVDIKEKLASDASTALAKEKEKFELVTQELNVVREHASREQRLVSESNMELEVIKGQLGEAFEQIEAMKEVIHQLNQKLVEKVQELKEADEKAKMVLAFSEEKQYILALNETKEIELRKHMEAVICRVHELSKMLADFECKASGSPEVNHARFTMELHDLLARCLAMIITVILIARISSCLNNAVLSEVNAPYVDNYVVKSYFNKHDSLVDSKFEDFIAHDILFGACASLQGNIEFSPQLSALHGKLIGEGSHRRLSSTLRLKMSSESISRPPKSCEVIIVERLPSGVFADPFELQHLVHHGVFRDAAVFGDTNLELPSFLSNRSLVEVHLEVGTNLTSQQKDELEIHMELPLHARYQPLGHGFSRIEFVSPDLFLRCNVERKEHDTSCLFLLDKQSAESIDTHAVWEVPCGNREHTEIVSAFTFISAVVSALLIIVASVRYSDNTASNVLKQS